MSKNQTPEDNLPRKKKYTVEGTISSFRDGKRKESDFEFDYENTIQNEEDNEKIFDLMDQDLLQLLKEGGSLGVKGIKRFIFIAVLFGGTNLLFFYFSIYKLLQTGLEGKALLGVMLVALCGVGITLYAAFLAYQFVATDAVRVMYTNAKPLFQKICTLIIDRCDKIRDGKPGFHDKELKEALNLGKWVNEKLKKLPFIFRKGVMMILKQIPILEMVTELQKDISDGKKEEASAKLFQKVDTFILETIFGSLNTNWVFGLWPSNLILSYMLIHMMIG